MMKSEAVKTKKQFCGIQTRYISPPPPVLNPQTHGMAYALHHAIIK